MSSEYIYFTFFTYIHVCNKIIMFLKSTNRTINPTFWVLDMSTTMNTSQILLSKLNTCMYCQDTVATIFYSEFLKEKLTNFQQIRQGATYTWHLLLMYKYICMYVYTTYKYYIAWEIRKLLLFFYHSWHVWENEGSGRENGFRTWLVK